MYDVGSTVEKHLLAKKFGSNFVLTDGVLFTVNLTFPFPVHVLSTMSNCCCKNSADTLLFLW